ncbi:uncharacterized protein LOC130963747 [Arachis stenosperma]|uniref:uncharacterized protein LOC130963747 n=1 Tax=Arachis stenosperma TaxID=217475 RepID=UPI0025ABBB38|nr:uncharacterized protein LOC130963747 [Arachis stenosperma]
MRWLLLLVIHPMVRVHWLVLTRAVATYITYQKISCNKKVRSICRTRRRNHISKKLQVSSLPQEVHQRYLSHLLIHEFGLLMVLIWFTSLKKPEEGSVSHRVQQLAKYRFLKFSCSLDPLVSYLSINYLDRFLSNHGILKQKAWALRLLAISCISLAPKMIKPGYSAIDTQVSLTQARIDMSELDEDYDGFFQPHLY